MRLRNTPWAYGPFARLNHWLGALLVLLMLGLGLVFPELSPGPFRTFLRTLHIAIGTLLLPLLFWRLVWAVSVPAPLPLARSQARRLLTRCVHLALLANLAAMLASGVLIQWLGGRPIGMFSLFRVGSPLALSALWEERMEACHQLAAWSLMALLALHLLGLLIDSLRHGGAAWARMGGTVRR